jgi:hypothetical protein
MFESKGRCRFKGSSHRYFPLCLMLASVSFACRCGCNDPNIHDEAADASTTINPDGGTKGGPYDSGTNATIGPGQWNPTTQNSTGVVLTDAGTLVLNSGGDQTDYAWISNCTGAQVSKIDTKTGMEVARYWSVVPVDGQGKANGLTPSPSGGCFNDGATSPSRTAVDLNGDVFVANRAPGGQGSATKIANLQLECVSRSGNGTIQTSSDLNGDGIIDPMTEMFPPADAQGNPTGNLSDPSIYDDCVLWSQPVGSSGPSGAIAARAIVIDQGIEGGAGNVWVGIHKESKFYKLDNATGAILPVGQGQPNYVSIPIPPYGAVVDGQGRLWAVGVGTGHLAMINTITGIADGVDRYTNSFSCLSSYGVGIDGKGRIWLPGLSCGAVAFRYDPSLDPTPTSPSTPAAWTEFDLSAAKGPAGAQDLGRGRGIAADDLGYVWMTVDLATAGAVVHVVSFAQDVPGCTSGKCTGVFKGFNTASGNVDYLDATDSQSNTAIGVALTSDENAWVNAYSGAALGIDRNTGAITKRYIGGNLYTYSDFTGYALRHFVAPRGWYNSVFTGCPGDLSDTQWTSVSWVADTSMCANNTKCEIEVYVKVANSLSQLNLPTTMQYGPFSTSPANLANAGVPAGAYLLVQTVLVSLDHATSPILDSVDVSWNCPGVFR